MKIKNFNHFIEVIKKIPQQTTAPRIYLNLSPKIYSELVGNVKPEHRYALTALADEGVEHLIQMFGKFVYVCATGCKGRNLSIDYTRTFNL